MSKKYLSPLYQVGPNFILCGSSALEFMQLFSGYLSVDDIYVYQINDNENVPSNYIVIPSSGKNIEFADMME